ncbi:hypothetical protein FDO65_04875 [Nakamurella flava]|uniref:Uncharacterized protein n=1 Tax=Nakamurella flava TaxID=2576308 RepID=A0A4U6QKF6_9ACTN|nr:hypothetical protein [Nakamurella flava]TKV60987.1 hypothetical protein FDO65_04875 [Nakamurella flava]
MARRSAISPRWLVVVLVTALTCSAVVVWALVRITGRAGGDAAADPTSVAASGPVSEPPTTSETNPGPSTAPPSSTPTAADEPSSSRATRSDGVTGAVRPPPVLPGSGLSVPAAWTGTAELTITVEGDCAATGGTSTYSGLTTDLALQAPVTGSDPFGDPNLVSMTLGVTPAAIPGLALYSAALDDQGAVRRTWWLAVGTDPSAPDRTVLSGALIADRPVEGDLPPNLLVDNETDLLPCQSGRATGVSRTLGAGSSLTGWVSATSAVIDVTGSTTDGERAVRMHAELQRLPTRP